MRFAKLDHLLQLALEMQGSREGLSLEDISNRFNVKRRTAMRMRDAILRNFPQAEETNGVDPVKRWRLPRGALERQISFSADELSTLELAAKLLDSENLSANAARVRLTVSKLRALFKESQARRIAPDLDALLEAEGLAARPGPRPRINSDILDKLRHAIKACKKVAIAHRDRGAADTTRRIVSPYGFLLGHRHYLVGLDVDGVPDAARLFTLAQIDEVEILETGFVRERNFSLSEFASSSFGVFHEEPVDVVWRFKPEAAPTARDYVFHPRQKMTAADDGSLVVRFRAGGLLEMAWHLYCWGDAVEVLAPQALRDLIRAGGGPWPSLP